MSGDLTREKIEAWLKQGALAAAKDMRVGDWPAFCYMALRNLDAPPSAILPISDPVWPTLLDYKAFHDGVHAQSQDDFLRWQYKVRRLMLAAAPAEGACSPTLTECPRCKNDIRKCDGLFGGKPNAPSPEERDICYMACRMHQGIPWTGIVSGFAKPMATVCPICKPPSGSI